MGFFPVTEKSKIISLLNHVISKRVAISVSIHRCDEQFMTKLLKVKRSGGPSSLIVEKLYPETGNSLIQASPDVSFSFEVSGSQCFFETKYIGINTQYPEFGLIVDFPPTVEIEDKRREERIEDGLSKFLSVEFVLEGDAKQYELKVLNVGSTGLGLVVDKENLDLLNKLSVGQTIRNLRFFLPQAVLTIDGTVRHKTQIPHGRLKGSYIVGIESDFIMSIEQLKEKLKKKR